MAHHVLKSEPLKRIIAVQTAEHYMIQRTRREQQCDDVVAAKLAAHYPAFLAGASFIAALGGLAIAWSSVLLRSTGA